MLTTKQSGDIVTFLEPLVYVLQQQQQKHEMK